MSKIYMVFITEEKLVELSKLSDDKLKSAGFDPESVAASVRLRQDEWMAERNSRFLPRNKPIQQEQSNGHRG